MSGKKKIILFIFIIIASSYNPIALETAVAPDYLLVPDNVRLTNNYSEIDIFDAAERTMNSFMRKWEMQGASVAIARDGQLVYAKGFGVADTLTGEVVQPYHRFRVASISKLITAVAIMKLVEDGKVSLDDKVFGPFGILNDPYFDDPRDKRAYTITVEHLLTHRGGWSQRYGDQMFMPVTVSERMGVKPPASTETIIRFALDKNLHFTPGRGRSYSNLGYSILGLIVEEVSGMTYELYCKQEVLEPLGIYDMQLAYNMPEDRAPYEVSYYTPSDILFKPSVYGTGELVNPTYGGNNIEALGGAGAWLATATDLMRLMLSIDGDDKIQDILSLEDLAYMTSQVNGSGPIGWKATYSSGIWTRTGSFPGTAGMMKRQPDGTLWVVLFNTSAWNGPLIHSYVNATMSRFIRQVGEWPEEDLYSHYTPVPLMNGFDPLPNYLQDSFGVE